MNAPLLTEQQIQEFNVRYLGQNKKADPVAVLVQQKPSSLPDVFSAQLAKQIVKNEELRFAITLIQNALELGQPEMALAQCKKALR